MRARASANATREVNVRLRIGGLGPVDDRRNRECRRFFPLFLLERKARGHGADRESRSEIGVVDRRHVRRPLDELARLALFTLLQIRIHQIVDRVQLVE